MSQENLSPRIQILQAEVDSASNPETDNSYFLIRVNNQKIKYLTISAGLYSEEDLCFGPALASLLPGIGPRFLGHLTEYGRVIRFLM